MACTTDFIDFILETLTPLGEVRSRKMMGDYVIYLNGKCVITATITACDNNAYVKKLPCIEELMKDAEVGCAYEGAKEGYIYRLTIKQMLVGLFQHFGRHYHTPKVKRNKCLSATVI